MTCKRRFRSPAEFTPPGAQGNRCRNTSPLIYYRGKRKALLRNGSGERGCLMHELVLRGMWTAAFLTLATISLTASPGIGASCGQVVALLDRGFSFVEVSEFTGASASEMQFCLDRGRVISPVGPAPHGAAGPAPHRAAGPAPLGAAGPAPVGAAGPAPHGAAGPAPHGAAGASPFGKAP